MPSVFAAILILIGSTAPGFCESDPVKGEATLSAAGGYARLVLKLADDVDLEVTTAGNIVVIQFKHPVDIPVETIADAAPDYVSSARRDPDGTAIRLSLARRVTVNTMSAGERIFVDLLPDSWVGAPPSLPSEVIRELAERARAAERALRVQRATDAAKKRPPIRVRASVQPTFVRFVFEMPDGVSVSSVLNEQKLTLFFNAVLNFDLADAKVAAPANIASISQKISGESSAVEVALIGDVDVHSFREDRNYIIDVAFQPAEKPQASVPSAAAVPAAPALAVLAPAAAAPAQAAPVAAASPAPVPPVPAPPASEKPSDKTPPPPQSSEKATAIPDKPAKEASVEVKPEIKPQIEPEIAAKAPAAPETPRAAPPASEVPPPEAPKASVAAAPAAEIMPGDNAASVSAIRDSEGLHVTFSFATITPAALFRRADTVWLIFDTTRPIDLAPFKSNGSAVIAEVKLLPLQKGQAIRIRLNRPQMPSLVGDIKGGNANWTLTFADTMQTPTQPLAATRNVTDPTLANVTVAFAKPGRLHRVVDPDAGDTLLVVTAPPPVRGFIKRQDFVEMSLLESIHGVAIRPNSDDVTAEIAPDKITIGRPGGLTLSSVHAASERAPTAPKAIFDVADWDKNKQGNFNAAQDARIEAVAALEADQRLPARMDLARLYMARGFYPEAKAVLDLALADAKPGTEDPAALIVHSVASTLMGRPGLALKDLANPVIGNNYDFAAMEGAGLWPAGQMGGGAREIQERRIRHQLAADRSAAHRDFGRDAGFARGQGLFRRRQAQQRSGSCRRPAGTETRGFGDARPARRGAWPRQGCLDPIPDRDRLFRPAGRGGGQIMRDRLAPEAQRNQPGRRVARARDA